MEGNDTVNKSNISNKVRMVNSGTLNTSWYAGVVGGGGSPYWESVTGFWTYVTGSKTVGPVGTGTSNGRYYQTNPDAYAIGQVLQKWNSSDKDAKTYNHSMYVTKQTPPLLYYSDTYVTQHSSDLVDRNLMDAIYAWGGNDCYIRYITFKSASFDK